jgi:hypothetical protein
MIVSKINFGNLTNPVANMLSMAQHRVDPINKEQTNEAGTSKQTNTQSFTSFKGIDPSTLGQSAGGGTGSGGSAGSLFGNSQNASQTSGLSWVPQNRALGDDAISTNNGKARIGGNLNCTC